MFKKMFSLMLVCGMISTAVVAQNNTFKAQNASYQMKSNSKFRDFMSVELNPIEVVAERIQKINPFKKETKEEAVFASNQYTDKAFIADPDTTANTGRKTDTTEIKVGKTRIIVVGEPKIEKIYMERDSTGDFNDDDHSYKESKKRKKDRSDSYFEWNIGFNGLLDNGSTTLSAPYKALDLENNKSINFSLGYHKRFNVIGDNVQLSAGIGLDWNNYRFSQNISFTPKKDSVTLFMDSVGGMAVNYKKNKLMSRYVTVPVMLHFATNENKSGNRFTLATGVELGYLINGRTKQVSDAKGKQKFNDDFNLRDLRYGLVGRIGYGDVAIYAKYYPQSAFSTGEGPNLNTYCVGLAFGGF